MTKLLLIFLLLIIITGCNVENNKKEIAKVNGVTIYCNNIDSIASDYVYNAKKRILKNIIREEILQQEIAKKQITKEKILQQEIKNKTHQVSSADIEKYYIENNVDKNSFDTLKIITFLKSQKIQERYEEYTDSLIELADLKIFLKKEFPKQINIKNVKYFNLTPPNKNTVYIISDYDCPNCMLIEPKVETLVKQYSSKVNFRYVFFSDYISKKALAVNAFSKQQNINKLHTFLFKSDTDIGFADIANFAKSQNIDTIQLKKDFESPSNLEELLETKENLINQNVYSTPTIVVNGRVLNDEFAIYQLENILENEIH
jgi:protein-disulfide isomerase